MPAMAQAQGETLFQNSCLMCHTVGKGKRVGPDLSGVHTRRSEDWLIQFIQSSESLIASGDPDAVAIAKEYAPLTMPDQPLSADEVRAIIQYIKEKSPAPAPDSGATAEPVVEEPPRPVSQADIDLGAHLFEGSVRFANKGAACIACHHVKNDAVIGGGLLARELTDVFSRMDGSAVQAILGRPPFPVMEAAYRETPLTEDEIHALTAFLQHADQEQFYQQPRDYGARLLYSGLAGAAVFFIVLGVLGSRRKKRCVNHDIYARQDDQLNK